MLHPASNWHYCPNSVNYRHADIDIVHLRSDSGGCSFIPTTLHHEFILYLNILDRPTYTLPVHHAFTNRMVCGPSRRCKHTQLTTATVLLAGNAS
jgi:hypothetical protein